MPKRETKPSKKPKVRYTSKAYQAYSKAWGSQDDDGDVDVG